MANITIQFLGTGSAWTKKYGNTSALVFIENKGVMKKLLIDCGRTTPDDLYQLGYTWDDLDAIFITHLHGDHVGGLEEAGFFGRYAINKKPHLIFPHPKLKTDLWDKVLKGTMMNGDLERPMNFEDYFTCDAVESEDEMFFYNGVMFSVFPTQHIKNKKSYGLIIGEQDYIIYSGDGLLNKDLISIGFSDSCQAVFHDCQLTDGKGVVHATLDDLKELEPQWRDNVYLMHYGDNLHEKYTEIKDAGFKIAVRGDKYQFTVTELYP